MLNNDFVPVAIDQWYERNWDDAGSKFYQKIASKGPRGGEKNPKFNTTTQGLYIATPGGEFIAYNNNYGAERIRKLMIEALKSDASRTAKPLDEDGAKKYELPDGGIVVQVNAKVLGGYEKPKDDFEAIFQDAISRDNLWITAEEIVGLKDNSFPDSLKERIARFHLLDNTRGEPNMWSKKEIKRCEFDLVDGKITGVVEMETSDGKRGFQADLRGTVTFEGDKVSGFDLVAKGEFWGEGRYTQGAPQGKFPLAVAFRVASEDDIAREVLPQGLKSHSQEYYE